MPSSSLQVEKLQLTEVNENPNSEDIPLENDSLDKTDFDSCTNTGAKNNYICNGSDKSVVFNFIQKKNLILF